MVRGLRPRDRIRGVVNESGRTAGNAGKIGRAERMRLTQLGNHTAQGASRTPPPTGWSVSNASAYNVMCAVPSRRTNGARAAPAKFHTLGGGRETDAPFASWSKSVNPNRCVYPAPAVTRPRCTEDGAPYMQQRNRACGIHRNGCDKLHPYRPPSSRLR